MLNARSPPYRDDAGAPPWTSRWWWAGERASERFPLPVRGTLYSTVHGASDRVVRSAATMALAQPFVDPETLLAGLEARHVPLPLSLHAAHWICMANRTGRRVCALV